MGLAQDNWKGDRSKGAEQCPRCRAERTGGTQPTLLTVAHIQEGHEDSEQPSHSHLAHELAITVIWAEGECSLAQMCQALVWQRKHMKEQWSNLGLPALPSGG